MSHSNLASDSPLSSRGQHVLSLAGQELNVTPGPGKETTVMGILNITPDSFYDGGQFLDPDVAMRRVKQMADEGACIIDVGGASSRPRGSAYGHGAEIVPAAEEIARIVPVIRAIADRFPEIIISADTCSALVAEAALHAGAHMINDITGLRSDPMMVSVIAERGVPAVLMHSVGVPGDMPHVSSHPDVIETVRSELARSIDRALSGGISQLIIDPGFGFGKTSKDNLKLIASISSFLSFGWPILIGVSRKSTIGRVLGSEDHPVPVDDRLFGSLGATAAAVMGGASIVRTHDVGPTVEMLRLFDAARPRI